MKSDIIIKKRCFTVEHSDLEDIKSKLVQLNGIELVTTETNKLIISYDLNQNNHKKLKNYLMEITTIKKESFLGKLQSSFICILERNEINHANNPVGWNYYVQNLYLSLHKDNHF